MVIDLPAVNRGSVFNWNKITIKIGFVTTGSFSYINIFGPEDPIKL